MKDRTPASYVCTAPDGRRFEFYEPRNVEKARAAGWKVQSITEYLAELNARIRAGGTA